MRGLKKCSRLGMDMGKRVDKLRADGKSFNPYRIAQDMRIEETRSRLQNIREQLGIFGGFLGNDPSTTSSLVKQVFLLM